MDRTAIQGALGAAVESSGAARASVAWLVDGATDTVELARGGAPAAAGSEDTVYGFGSVTKLLVASLVADAVASGRLGLDVLLPHIGEGATARRLLSHTSGLDGDFFLEPERAGDLDAYVAAWRELVPPIARPGRYFSYCNAGFVALGAQLQRCFGLPFDDVLHQRLLARIPSDTLGTEVRSDEFPAALAPAGSTLRGRALDLALCARHWLTLDRGRLEVMLAPQIALPADPWAHAWALGWQLGAWSGRRAAGHRGMTMRDCTSLWLFPDDGIALAVTSEGGDAPVLHAEVLSTLGAALAGLVPPRVPQPTSSAVSAEVAARVVGAYGRRGLRSVVEDHGAAGLRLRGTPADEVATFFGALTESRLSPLDEGDDDAFAESGASARPGRCVFLEPGADGRAQLMWSGRRLSRRDHTAGRSGTSGADG